MLAFHYRPCVTPYAPPTWADGTDAEIAEAVAKADAGEIDLSDYWSVGDERTVHLGAIPANNQGAFTTAMAKQDVVMVLMNEGYMSQEGIHFVVGQKDILSQNGRMNSINTNNGSWNSTLMRAALNRTTSGGYYYAIPDDLKPIFKEFTVTTTASYNSVTNQTGTDKFALFAEKEVFGSRSYSLSTEAIVLGQIKYYETSSNRIKYCAAYGGNYHWWERSPCSGDSGTFCLVASAGSATSTAANYSYGVAPFGCI